MERTDSNYIDSALEIAEVLAEYANFDEQKVNKARESALKTSRKADWKYFITRYYEAFKIASKRRDERLKRKN